MTSPISKKSVSDPAALAQLIKRLDALRPESERRWGSLTPGEMVCHLGDAATSVLGRPGQGEGPSRPLMRWVALYSPLPWPRGAKTLPRIDPRREGTKPGDFEEDRRRAAEGLRAVAKATEGALPAAHAVFGRMRAEDWYRWAYRHADHHLRQFGL